MFRPRLTSPAYHHVANKTLGCTAHLGVTTCVADFEAHLDYFARNYDVVDLDTVLSGRWPKRPLLLTFDDSYRTTLTTVAPILRRRELPAVVFLNPDPIEQPVVMFDHLLSEIASRFGVPALCTTLGAQSPERPSVLPVSVHSYLNGQAARLDRTSRNALQRHLLDRFELDEAQLRTELDVYLSPTDITALAAAGLEIGNHTASHVRCRSLTLEEAATEIVEAKHRLERLSGTIVRTFSLPYGSRRDVSEVLMSSVRDAGHEAIFLAEGRRLPVANRPNRPFDRIPMDAVASNRLSVHLTAWPAYRELKDTLRGR
jgi:peptidoglycan/xylan/chitin deacetylase (PgdA/CDA1 family)